MVLAGDFQEQKRARRTFKPLLCFAQQTCWSKKATWFKPWSNWQDPAELHIKGVQPGMQSSQRMSRVKTQWWQESRIGFVGTEPKLIWRQWVIIVMLYQWSEISGYHEEQSLTSDNWCLFLHWRTASGSILFNSIAILYQVWRAINEWAAGWLSRSSVTRTQWDPK